MPKWPWIATGLMGIAALGACDAPPVRIGFVPLAPVTLQPAETRDVELVVEIPPGSYLMSDRDLDLPRVGWVVSGEGIEVRLGETAVPVAREFGDVFVGAFRQTLTLTAIPEALAGERTLLIRLDYASCDERVCYPPAQLEATLHVTVASPG